MVTQKALISLFYYLLPYLPIRTQVASFCQLYFFLASPYHTRLSPVVLPLILNTIYKCVESYSSAVVLLYGHRCLNAQLYKIRPCPSPDACTAAETVEDFIIVCVTYEFHGMFNRCMGFLYEYWFNSESHLLTCHRISRYVCHYPSSTYLNFMLTHQCWYINGKVRKTRSWCAPLMKY